MKGREGSRCKCISFFNLHLDPSLLNGNLKFRNKKGSYTVNQEVKGNPKMKVGENMGKKSKTQAEPLRRAAVQAELLRRQEVRRPVLTAAPRRLAAITAPLQRSASMTGSPRKR